jgi:hypothetical protein
MSVVLLPPTALARLAVFARGCDALPPGLSAEDFARALHQANLEAWLACYPHRTPELEGLSVDPVETAALPVPGLDPMALIRTARDLLYNAELGASDPLTTALNKIMQNAADILQKGSR